MMTRRTRPPIVPLARRLLLWGCLAALVAAAWPLGAAGVVAAPTLTLDPERGPCGSRIVVRGAGLPPGSTVSLLGERADGDPRSRTYLSGFLSVAADGSVEAEVQLWCNVDAADAPDGTQFRIAAVPQRNYGGQFPPPSDYLASALFTVSSSLPLCFSETGQCVRGRFLAYWLRHGALALNGYPLSEEFEQQLEDGKVYRVQYFERVRMEHHPENAGTPYEVLLGQFGRRILATVPNAPTTPVAPLANARYFRETGHNVQGTFVGFWETYGGLAQFGYPISEEFERRLQNGQVYRVQYFERARFEHHPERQAQYDVVLGQFGRRILAETTGR